MKRGKKYIEAAKLIERGNLYDKNEAVALVKKAATAKFDETIEAHIRTGCDGRHADQQIRGLEQRRHWSSLKILKKLRLSNLKQAKLFGLVVM